MTLRRPIGIFDSGVGGLTVLKALRERLPSEQYLYLGDTARLPYGTKTEATVRRYAVNAAAHLVDRGVKLMVVACNTASSYALQTLAEASPVPVVGVVLPGVRAALLTGAKHIGVIGTEGTVRSRTYQRTLADLGPAAEVRAVPCPLFVPLAEEG
jgi:glutamate racemase